MAYNSAPLISKSHLVIFLTLGYLRGLGHESCKDVTFRKQNCYKHLLWNGAFGPFLLSPQDEQHLWSPHPTPRVLPSQKIDRLLKINSWRDRVGLGAGGCGWDCIFFFFFKSWFQFCNSVLLGNQGASFFTWFWTGSEAEIKIWKKWKNTFTPAANDLLLHVIISTFWSCPFYLLMWSLPQFCHIN